MKKYSVFVVCGDNQNTLVENGLGLIEAKILVDGINHELSSRSRDRNMKAVFRREKND